jgi:hypothetical protein
LRNFSSGETDRVNDVLVSSETPDRNDGVREFLFTKIFEVIANLMAQLSQPTSQSIMDNVCGYSIAPGRVSMSG